MKMNMILVCIMCPCNLYAIPESIRRKDLGYKFVLHDVNQIEPFQIKSRIRPTRTPVLTWARQF